MRRTCLMQTVSFRRLSARVLQPIVAQVIMKNKSGLIPAVTMALVLASAAVSHLAAAENTFTWSGAGGDGNWGTSANWSTAGGSVVPTVNLQGFCNFPGSTRLNNTNNFTVGAGAHQMYFKSGAGAFNLYGNSLTFFDFGGVDPNIQNDGTTSQTMNIPFLNGNANGANGILNINLNTTTAQGPLVCNATIGAADANIATTAMNA